MDIFNEDLAVFTGDSSITPETLRDHLAFITSDQKRSNEVTFSRLSASDKLLFQKAKDSELDQWISHSIFKIVQRAGVPTSRIMPMRWVLTWKEVKEGEHRSTKAKARLVVKGFMDPDLTTLRAEAPTLSKQARHMLLQLGASHKFTFEVGDVKTAFLQGDKGERERDIFLEPNPEIIKRLKMTHNQVLRLVGSAYGLRTAPRHWYQRVKHDMLSLGWKLHSLDACTFLFYDNNDGTLIGICGVYVDDFLIAGRKDDPRWHKAKKDLIALYKWGKWEIDTFNLCGVRYRQHKDFSITMDQEEYTKQLHKQEHVPPNFNKTSPKTKLDKEGHKCLRGINGSLQWLVTNTRVDLSARVSFSASASASPTYADLSYANKLLRQAQRDCALPLIIHAIPLDKLTFGAFTDAAWAVRPDGSSQGGFLVYAAHSDLLDGAEAQMSIIDWKSWKLKRKVRSSLAAESQAMADTVDTLNFVRLFMAECIFPQSLDLRRVDEIYTHLPPAHIITDCKSLFDALERSESAGLGLADKRTAIEVTATRDQMRQTNISTKWVNSDRQLADILTKPTVPAHMIHHLQKTGRWKIVFDETYTSAKKLRKQARDNQLKINTQNAQQRAMLRSLGTLPATRPRKTLPRKPSATTPTTTK